MAVSSAQVARVSTTCKCGCNETFSAFPLYRSKAEGGGLRTPDYKRGHHPNCRKTQTGGKPAWNSGLKKGDHPSIERMGYQLQPIRNPDWLDPAFDHIAFSKLYKNMSSNVRGSKKAYAKFRSAILRRDNCTCQDCKHDFGQSALGNLDVHIHHIVTVTKAPDRIFDDENVVTLCRQCHFKRHRGHKKIKRSL